MIVEQLEGLLIHGHRILTQQIHGWPVRWKNKTSKDGKQKIETVIWGLF